MKKILPACDRPTHRAARTYAALSVPGGGTAVSQSMLLSLSLSFNKRRGSRSLPSRNRGGNSRSTTVGAGDRQCRYRSQDLLKISYHAIACDSYRLKLRRPFASRSDWTYFPVATATGATARAKSTTVSNMTRPGVWTDLLTVLVGPKTQPLAATLILDYGILDAIDCFTIAYVCILVCFLGHNQARTSNSSN